MLIQVRPAAPHESADVADIAARTFALACPPTAAPADIAAVIETRLSAQSFADSIADPERHVAVALLEGDIVGYTMLIFGPPADEDVARQLTVTPTAELSKIYVDPVHHGGAVAQALIDDAVAQVRDAGGAAIWLGTNQANRRAQRFYEKNGFVQIGTKRFRLGSRWEDDFVYERVL